VIKDTTIEKVVFPTPAPAPAPVVAAKKIGIQTKAEKQANLAALRETLVKRQEAKAAGFPFVDAPVRFKE
jgi:hypothetical protein